jgi:oxygen-independent coproporphyrinogen-3 oxidase
MNSLGIYISIPFCRSKCSYCNFASGVYASSALEKCAELLIEDLRSIRARLETTVACVPDRVDSVYFGGGTPSTLPPAALRSIFAAVRDEFEVARDAEITLECAPGQVSDDFLQAMLDCGVNRTSFGVQSFVDREAAVTGRLHNREIALRDLERMREAGIARVNVDLIAGLPHQTAESWRESLETLVSSVTNHASIYMLEVDEDSRLGKELLNGGSRYHADSVPSDDQVAEFYSEAVEFLASHGLAQYEISNFAQPGMESLHNEKYWLRQPYLGFGLDAHSMLRSAEGQAVRFETADDLGTWLRQPHRREYHWLSRRQELEEAWFLGLRRMAGVSRSAVSREFGDKATEPFDQTVAGLVEDGLLAAEGDRVRLTARGCLLSNEVFGRFLELSEEDASQDEQFALEVT